ncbi:MarR family winged helix-turn-helix transcriptional regulator [Flexivirga caeni]|uniref:MarR family transcriptional regulator n=1 Tax=Flexivirga caeni TaxID=2294115 RepID=A0A3M9M6N5_9MICO|nr:MarR family transcriptional regulator [Flexivirga caeni]RNI21146.1 MarR family transcriptional regulator [Flexivirga caeni]
MAGHQRVTDADYARLLRLRTRLRQFERWSAEQAAARGLTASQHQLLLAIRGHGGAEGPTIGEVAEYLLVRHNTAVELVNRTQELGLVERIRDGADQRVVRLALTSEGRKRLNELSAEHLEELARLATVVEELFDALRT